MYYTILGWKTTEKQERWQWAMLEKRKSVLILLHSTVNIIRTVNNQFFLQIFSFCHYTNDGWIEMEPAFFCREKTEKDINHAMLIV